MNIKGLIRAAGLGMSLALATASSASAQDSAASFYKGKNVRFVVGLGVGGGFDAYARMIAPYLSRELDATVIVENLPGAGGLLALNQMFTGQPDGLRLLIVNGTPAALGQLWGLLLPLGLAVGSYLFLKSREGNRANDA